MANTAHRAANDAGPSTMRHPIPSARPGRMADYRAAGRGVSRIRSMAPSLDQLQFAADAMVVGGEVGTETVFTYHEADGEIWAVYVGGEIKRGYLVGTRQGDALEFRYVQLNSADQTSSGHCCSIVSEMADGRLRLDETWEWESKPGNGTSAVVQI